MIKERLGDIEYLANVSGLGSFRSQVKYPYFKGSLSHPIRGLNPDLWRSHRCFWDRVTVCWRLQLDSKSIEGRAPSEHRAWRTQQALGRQAQPAGGKEP